MTPDDDADDPLLVALRGLPVLDVGPGRAARLSARCRAEVARKPKAPGSTVGAGVPAWVRRIGFVCVVAWSAAYVAGVVRVGWLVWSL